MLQRARRRVKFILAFLFAIGCIYLGYIKKSDIEQYNQLVQKEARVKPKQDQQQLRAHCSKHLYKSEGKQRIHYQITAPRSTLMLYPRENHIELVENLTDISCLLEERQYEPNRNTSRQVRQLEAKRGLYSYDQQKLETENVFLTIYHTNKEVPAPQDAILTGTADEATFELAKEVPTFTATEFQANIQSRHTR